MTNWLNNLLKIGGKSGPRKPGNRSRRPVGLCLESLESRDAPAGTPGLLKDVFADNAAGNSNSRAYAPVNAVVLFAGRTRQNATSLGVELWSTQGTPASTVLLKDINPGGGDGLDLNVVEFVRLGNRVFFSANDGTSGFELWQSDGSAVGTVRVKDINPGAASSTPNNMVVVGNKILFWANNGTNGNELWVTDGTAIGTQLVKDINPGFNGSGPQNLRVVGTKIYFGGVVQTIAVEPWVSDGTPVGTFLLKDINPGANSSDPSEFTEVNGFVVFAAFEPATGREIWRTDGTAVGTSLLKDIVPGATSSNPTQLTKVNASVYFIANDDIHVTGGTTANTVLVTATPFAPNYLYNYNGQLIFESDVVSDPSILRLWSATGNVASVFAVIPRNPLLATTRFYGWLNLGTRLVFFQDDGIRGFEPWVTDLTQAGTFNLRDIRSGSVDGVRQNDMFALNWAVANNIAYFVASDQSTNFELWRSDGTTVGTTQVADINPGNFNSDPNNLTVIGNTMYLTMTQSVPTGSPAATGAEPYAMDVSTGGGVGGFKRADIIGRQEQNGRWFVATSTGTTFNTTQIGAWSVGITWSDVLKGDFNGDGLDDVVGRWNETGQWWVGISNGSALTNSLWSVWSPASAQLTWADVRVGDFNGDGKDDIAGRYLQTGQWWVGLSTGSQFATSLWTVWAPGAGVNWVDVRVADYNNDGKSDILGRWNETGQWWNSLANAAGTQFTTSFWGVWSVGANVTWVDVLAGDLNNDGRDDIIGRFLQTGQWFAGLSTGATFNMSLFGTWSTAATYLDVNGGDFNADGRMDIVGRNSTSGQVSVALSTGTAITTTVWGTWLPTITWLDVQVGDFNGDGFSDLAGRAQSTGIWQVSRSNGTSAFTTSNWGAAWATNVTWVDVQITEFNNQ